MWIAYLLTGYLGIAAVLQGGINRKLAEAWGLPGVTLLNAIVLLLTSAGVFFLAQQFPSEGLFRVRGAFQNISWWYVIPGIIGFSIVLLVPYAIQKLGALNLFIALIGSQLIGGAIWDYCMEGIPITPSRVIGAVLAFASALIAAWKS